MRELSYFADSEHVWDLMKHYGEREPTVIRSKKGVCQYRQNAESRARHSLSFISDDFDLLGFPLARDIPVRDRKGFTAEKDILTWLMGNYEPPESSRKLLTWLDDFTLSYTKFPEWMESRKPPIDINEERDVKMRLLVTKMDPDAIPDTVKDANDIGIEVRRYMKKEDMQPRGCVIDPEGEHPNIYLVFREFEEGKVTTKELKPGVPQEVGEGRIWYAFATDNDAFIREYLRAYEAEWKESRMYDDVRSDKRSGGRATGRVKRISRAISRLHQL